MVGFIEDYSPTSEDLLADEKGKKIADLQEQLKDPNISPEQRRKIQDEIVDLQGTPVYRRRPRDY